jgi:hypothetical protein
MNQLIRVLIPSWRFFDGTVDAPILTHRTSSDGLTFSEWQLTIPKPAHRTILKLFLNATENHLFATHALIEYLKNDLVDGVNATTSIELVKNLVIHHTQPESFFQFRLTCEVVDYTSEVYRR